MWTCLLKGCALRPRPSASSPVLCRYGRETVWRPLRRKTSRSTIWIGLSLHHLRAPAKSKAMRAARKLLDERGMLLVYEHTSPDGEDREGWFRRWELLESDWTALTPEEWRRLAAHVRTYDFPETASG